MDGVQIGAGTGIERSVVGRGAQIGAGCTLSDAVIGDNAVIGAGCELLDGARVWPGVLIPAGGIRFSSDG